MLTEEEFIIFFKLENVCIGFISILSKVSRKNKDEQINILSGFKEKLIEMKHSSTLIY